MEAVAGFIGSSRNVVVRGGEGEVVEGLVEGEMREVKLR